MFYILHGIATLLQCGGWGGISEDTYHSVTIFPNDLISKENITLTRKMNLILPASSYRTSSFETASTMVTTT